MKTRLDPGELAICKHVGRMRSVIARNAGVRDAKVGSHDGAEADEQGMIAEYAFAKLFNVFPDFGLSPRSGSADGICKGKRYDVKSTKHKSGRLLATLKNNPDVDIYVLAIVDGAEVSFPGWAYKDELMNERNIKDLGRGKGYALEQRELRKFKG